MFCTERLLHAISEGKTSFAAFYPCPSRHFPSSNEAQEVLSVLKLCALPGRI